MNNTGGFSIICWDSKEQMSDVQIKDQDNRVTLLIPVPGIGLEEADSIKIAVKNDVVTVELPETVFKDASVLMYASEFPLKKKTVTPYIEDGVLSIVMDKPKDYEFTVNIY